MEKKTVRDIDVKGKRVLLRVDFNVPMDETGKILDNSRVYASIPTIQYLVNHGARVIIAAHLGRPKGKPDSKYSLRPVVPRLSGMLGQPVGFAEDCIGPETENLVNGMKNGDVLLLENVRFHAEEENGDPAFAKALVKLADIYVDDAFGTAHRSHVSIIGVTKYLPAFAGLLLEKELATLGGLLTNPAHPFGSLLGGAKVSDKVALMENMLKGRVDFFLVGGGMAATFLKACGYEIGQSLFEEDRVAVATGLIQEVKGNGVQLILPVDVVVTDEVSEKGIHRTVSVDKVPKDMKIVDIGQKTIELFSAELKKCQTIFWNGPMGVYEIPQFARGTEAMAKTIAGLHARTIIGGGSTAETVINMGLAGKMTFISTGGGATMSFLSGETMPGVEVLLDKEQV
ncbi:MAG: phosphoglycerate kinase [Dehalococcoidia bacterium]|nr:phosphoglycerate kinase [Dehalococcoidia bacterium]